MLATMIPRTLESTLREHATTFPAVLLTGPRQSGKTTLATATFRHFRYVSLEDLQNRQEASEDPARSPMTVGLSLGLGAAPGVALQGETRQLA